MTGMLSPETILPYITPYADRPLLVAFSGGVDSTVLLQLLVALRASKQLHTLSAVHINHGLSDYAADWSDHCESICEQLSVPLVVRKVAIESSADIELQARNLRYQVFEELLPENGCLLMGHHQDDQAETLLFRLFRGSGVDGLAGIPFSRMLGRGKLLRPMLSFSRKQIEDCAKLNQFTHIEDDSNTDQAYTRNYLRHSLIPEVERQWPGVNSRLAMLADELKEARELIGDVVEAEYEKVAVVSPGAVWGNQDLIAVDRIQALPFNRVNRVLRFWLNRYQCSMPDRRHLEIIVSEILGAREDGEPCFKLAEFEVRRSGNFLVLLKSHQVDFLPVETHWKPSEKPRLMLPDGSFLTINGSQSVDYLGIEITVKYREHLSDGLKIRVAGRSGSKTVKRWLQEYRVPPWMRNRIPFLFVGDRMIAAASLWSCNELDVAEQIIAAAVWSEL